MHISAYLRASTDTQDPLRGKQSLIEFADERDLRISSWYIENASGATANRPELMRLLDESREGDVILVEAIDRITRLTTDEWNELKKQLDQKRLKIVSLDIPTSHQSLSPLVADQFTSAVIDSINSMLIDVLAAVSRKDYEQTKERQKQGIAKAKSQGKYRGRQANYLKHEAILKVRASGHTIPETAEICGVSVSTVNRVCRKNKR